MRFGTLDETHVPGLLSAFHSNVGKWFAANEEADYLDLLNRLLNKGFKEENFYHVLFNGDQIIGGGGMFIWEQCSELSWGLVHNDFHGKGIGAKLLEFRLNNLKANYPQTQSVISQTSPAAAGFYAKYGFVEKYREPNFWGGQIELVGMELTFDGLSRYEKP